jgi:hypothetical protein
MRKFVVPAVVVVVVVLAVSHFKGLDKRAFHRFSRERVEKMLTSMKSGRSADLQDAMGYWYVGHPMPAEEMVYTQFETFLYDGGLSTQIRDFEILDSELVNGNDVVNRYVRVDCRIDGKNKTMKLVHGSPISWY